MNRRYLAIAIGVAAMVITATLVAYFWPTAKPQSQAEQVAAAARAQLTPPRQLDEVTRLDAIEAEGSTIVYRYTLSRSDPELIGKLRENLPGAVCSKSEMKLLLSQGFAFEYRYQVANADALPPFTFTAASCAGR